MKRLFRLGLGLLAAGLALLLIYYQFTTPSQQGPWKPEYDRMATTVLAGDRVHIRNFRRARYDDAGIPVTVEWTDRSVDLSTLKDVWLGISVFGPMGFAHSFLAFDFGDGDPVVLSIEARQRPDQSYGPIAGMLDRFPLIYVIADERDIVGVRTHGRGNQVYFQPLTISAERGRRLFLDMIARANALVEEPEFYNTFATNCTNAILRDTEMPAWQRYFDPRILLPGYSDRVAYQYGILDRRYSREALRAAAYLDPAIFALDDPQFSRTIRENFLTRIAREGE